MTTSVQDKPSQLYPEIESYVLKRKAEFDQISDERKSELQQLAGYIDACIAKGQDALLTFVCTHNSRRSHLTQIWTQIAAAYYGVNPVQTFSGGTEVTACNPRTVSALKRSGLRFRIEDEYSSNPHYVVSYSDQHPPLICFSKIFNRPPNPVSNYCAVMTCSHADQNCPVAIGCDLRLAIRYEDPKVSDDTPQETATYDERCAQIARDMLYAISQVKN